MANKKDAEDLTRDELILACGKLQERVRKLLAELRERYPEHPIHGLCLGNGPCERCGIRAWRWFRPAPDRLSVPVCVGCDHTPDEEEHFPCKMKFLRPGEKPPVVCRCCDAVCPPEERPLCPECDNAAQQTFIADAKESARNDGQEDPLFGDERGEETDDAQEESHGKPGVESKTPGVGLHPERARGLQTDEK